MSRASDPRVYTNELLERTIVPASGQRVLCLGIAPALIVAWTRAVGTQGKVTAVEHWLPDWRRLEIEVRRLPASAPLQRHFAADLAVLGDATFDIVAIDCSSYPSNKSLYRLAEAAAEMLVIGGKLFAAGPKESGIMTLTKRCEHLLGNVEPLAYRKGQRIIVSTRGDSMQPLDDQDRLDEAFTVSIGDIEWTLEADPSVFAKGALDDATAMLLSAIDIEAHEAVLDLGCGAGLLGMGAALLASGNTVVMTDADAHALELAERNCARNGISNVRIVAADIVDTIQNERFDVVICNPPFHQRHEQASTLADRFMRGAASVLKAETGRLYFVANRFLPYESRLANLFFTVEEATGDDRYKVLLARGPRPGMAELAPRAPSVSPQV